MKSVVEVETNYKFFSVMKVMSWQNWDPVLVSEMPLSNATYETGIYDLNYNGKLIFEISIFSPVGNKFVQNASTAVH